MYPSGMARDRTVRGKGPFPELSMHVSRSVQQMLRLVVLTKPAWRKLEITRVAIPGALVMRLAGATIAAVPVEIHARSEKGLLRSRRMRKPLRMSRSPIW